MQTLLGPPVRVEKKRDFRRLLKRVQLGPRAAKAVVIVVFTFCWLVVALVRSNVPRDTVSLDGSSLMGLARYMQDGAISGRDFQSIFGPITQLLAWVATSLTNTRSPVDANGMIAFFFGSVTAILIGIMLLVCDRVSWQDSVIVYAFCFLLNLFFGVLDFRTAL